MTGTATSARLDGLDLARYLAFVGMVIVNFKVVMGAEEGGGPLGLFTSALEGRAAATFVILAGVGLGLASLKNADQTIAVTLRRAAFLLVVGLINTLVFEADIIHYYAFYFLIGAFLLHRGTATLTAAIVLVNIVFVAMIFTLDYERGWDWTNLSYTDFWTPAGFVRNLFFNGWHPVFPWLGFLLYGIILSRLSLAQWTTQRRLIIAGIVMFALAEAVNTLVSPMLAGIDPELAFLTSTHPIPPMPLYTLAGIGAGSVVIGTCLALADLARRFGLLQLLSPAGRQTLTLYLAHILIGMGTLEALGLLGGQSVAAAVGAALVFCLVATAFALLWSGKFRHGPVEMLMRRIAG